MADVVVINKVDRAEPDDVLAIERTLRDVNPAAIVVLAASPVTLEPGPSLAGKRVLVIDDGPTITHGGMPFGAGIRRGRGRAAPREFVDPRPFAVGSIAETCREVPASSKRRCRRWATAPTSSTTSRRRSTRPTATSS